MNVVHNADHLVRVFAAHENLALVVSEVSLACILLVSARLRLRSFLGVFDVNLGLESDHAASS